MTFLAVVAGICLALIAALALTYAGVIWHDRDQDHWPDDQF